MKLSGTIVALLAVILCASVGHAEDPKPVNLAKVMAFKQGASYKGSAEVLMSVDISMTVDGNPVAQTYVAKSTSQYTDKVKTVNPSGFLTAFERNYGKCEAVLNNKLDGSTNASEPSYSQKTVEFGFADGKWNATSKSEVTQRDLKMLAASLVSQETEFAMLPDKELKANESWQVDETVFKPMFLAGFKAGMGLPAEADCNVDITQLKAQITSHTAEKTEFEIFYECKVRAVGTDSVLVVGYKTTINGVIAGKTIESNTNTVYRYSTEPVAEGQAPGRLYDGGGELTTKTVRTAE